MLTPGKHCILRFHRNWSDPAVDCADYPGMSSVLLVSQRWKHANQRCWMKLLTTVVMMTLMAKILTRTLDPCLQVTSVALLFYYDSWPSLRSKVDSQRWVGSHPEQRVSAAEREQDHRDSVCQHHIDSCQLISHICLHGLINCYWLSITFCL